MQGNVRVGSSQPCSGRSKQTQHRRKWTGTEAGEPQIEPSHVRLDPPQRSQKSAQVAMLFETPTANDPEAGQFLSGCWEIISQHRQIDAGFVPKVLRNMVAILIERMATRRKRSDESNLHGSLRNTRSRESRPRRCK